MFRIAQEKTALFCLALFHHTCKKKIALSINNNSRTDLNGRDIQFAYNIIQLWVFLIALLLLLHSTEIFAYPSSDPNYSIENMTLVGKKRVSRFSYDYTYTVDIISAASNAANINITVATTAAGATIVEQDLEFGTVAAGATVTSLDSFTLRQNRRFKLDREAISWTIQSIELTDLVAPVVSLTVPKQVQAGALLSASVQVSDNQGVERVSFYVDGLLVKEQSESPFVFSYNTSEQAEQALEIKVLATDAAGNEGTAILHVPIAKTADTEAPKIIAINLPAEAAVGETITLQAVVTDNHNVAEVQFNFQGSLIKAVRAPPFQTQFTVPAEVLVGEILSIELQAFDEAGNNTTEQASFKIATLPDTLPPEAVTIQAPATALAGQLLALNATAVDNTGVLKVVFFADEVVIGADHQAPFTALYTVPIDKPVGEPISFKAIATDFSTNQTESDPVQSLIKAPGEGFIVGEVYNDSNGLPVKGASISLLSVAGRVLAPPRDVNTDEQGRYRFSSTEGNAVLRISRDGMSPVYRNLEVMPGEISTAFDARLTPHILSQPITPTTSTTLSVHKDEIELQILPGALSETVDLALTSLSAQGLPGLLPIGWSPLAAVAIDTENLALNVPLTLSFKEIFTPETIAIHWHTATQRWIRLATETTENKGLQIIITEPGGYALVRPDAQPAAPPPVAIGQALIAVSGQTIPDNIAATMTPNPDILFMQPGVHSDVTVTLQNNAPLPSGTPLTVDFSEYYQRTDATSLSPTPSSQDMLLYQKTTGFSAGFTATPSQIFDPALLKKGQIHLEARRSDNSQGQKIIGTGGGTISAPEATNLDIPAGALNTPTPVTVSPLLEPIAALENDSRFEFLAGASVDFGEATLSGSAVLHINLATELDPDKTILLLQATNVSGTTRLELVGIATLNGNSIAVGGGGLGLPLPGIRTSGRYYLVQMQQPVAYLTGQVSNNGVVPQSALVETDVLPFVSLVDNIDPFYTVVGILTELIVNAQDRIDGSTATTDVTLIATNEIQSADLSLAVSHPTVLKVTPNDGATGIALSSAISIQFSRQMNPLTINAINITLTKAGQNITGMVTLAADRKIAIFQPEQLLNDETLYTVSISTSVKDDFGNLLSGNQVDQSFQASFTTMDVIPPEKPSVGTIINTPPENGVTTISGTQGSVEPGALVTVINTTTGVNSSVVAGSDGSFSVSLTVELLDRIKMLISDDSGNQTEIELGRPAPPLGVKIMGQDGGRVVDEMGQSALIPSGFMPPDTIVSLKPFDTSGLSSLVDDDPQGYIGAGVTFSMGDVEIAGVMEMVFSVDGQPDLTIVDRIPLFDEQFDIAIPDNVQPGSNLTLRIQAQDKLGHITQLSAVLPIVAAIPDDTPRTERVDSTSVLLLTMPTEAVSGQIIHIRARAQTPDIKLRFPADPELTGNEQFIIYSVREFAGRTVFDLVDTATLKTLEDGSRVIETNSPPFRGLRRNVDNVVMAVRRNVLMAYGQVLANASTSLFGGVTIASSAPIPNQVASMIREFSQPRPANISLYEFGVVPVIADQPTTINLIDLNTNAILAQAEMGALPPGGFSGVLLLGEDENNPLITDTTSFRNDAVPVDAKFDIAFSHVINTVSVNPNTLFLIDEETGGKVEVEIIHQAVEDSEHYIVQIRPLAPLLANHNYTIVATAGIKRPNDKNLENEFTMAFHTAGAGRGIVGFIPIDDIDSFDVLGLGGADTISESEDLLAVVSARSIDGSINSLLTVSLADPLNPEVVGEKRFSSSHDGGIRGVAGIKNARFPLQTGGIFEGDLAIATLGSSLNFGTLRTFDISNPESFEQLSGTLVSTPAETLLESQNITVIVPDPFDFSKTEVYDPFLESLDGVPMFPALPVTVDTNGREIVYFSNIGIGLMTIDLGHAIPPPVEERGIQFGPSFPPSDRAGALVIMDDPTLLSANEDFAITQPASLMIHSSPVSVAGTISNENISKILVNGFVAQIQLDSSGVPQSFNAEVPLHEGYNILVASAFDKNGQQLAILQQAAPVGFRGTPFKGSGEIALSIPPIVIGSETATIAATVTETLLFDQLFINGELVSQKFCAQNVTQQNNHCDWSGSGSTSITLAPGANLVIASAVDIDEGFLEFRGKAFHDIRVAEGVVLAVDDDPLGEDLWVLDASGLLDLAKLEVPGASRVSVAKGVMTDIDEDGRTGIAENQDGDSVTVFDELRTLALVGTRSQNQLYFVDITEPHNATVLGHIDLGDHGAFRAWAVPEQGIAYLATGDGIAIIDITRPYDSTGSEPDDRILDFIPLPQAQDIQVDSLRGLAYVLEKDLGIAVIQLDACFRDVGVDATRLPASRVARIASLSAERDALRRGISNGMATDACSQFSLTVGQAEVSIGPIVDPVEVIKVGLLSQGSSACIWRADEKCSTAYQPGLSDHDFELIVADGLLGPAQQCAEQIEKEIKEEDIMAAADVSVFPVPRSSFTLLYRDVGRRLVFNSATQAAELHCGGGDDLTADLCLGRNGLILKWILEGEWVSSSGNVLYDGEINLEQALNILRSPIDENTEKIKNGQRVKVLSIGANGFVEPTHVPRLEGKEWACLQDFNLNKDGVRIRIKGSGLGDIPIQVPAFRKQIQKAGKAGIRAAFGKLLSTNNGNKWVLGSSRLDYNSFEGCYTDIDNPDLDITSVNQFSFKRCESFEEYVASKALLSVVNGFGFFTETEAIDAYQFFRRKSDVGKQISDETEANEFISKVMMFIYHLRKPGNNLDPIYTNTIGKFEDGEEVRKRNYDLCKDEHIPSYKPGGKNFRLKVPVRVFNNGFVPMGNVRLELFHDDEVVSLVEVKDNVFEEADDVEEPVEPKKVILTLAPGEAKFLDFRISPKENDSYKVQLLLDPQDDLVEFDKSNNFDGFFYYYLSDAPTTNTEVLPNNTRPSRPGLPPGFELPDPPASQVCLVDDVAPPSPSVEFIPLISNQFEIAGGSGTQVERQWIIRNIGNITLTDLQIYDSILGFIPVPDIPFGQQEIITRQVTIPNNEISVGISTLTGKAGETGIGVSSGFIKTRSIGPDAEPKLEPVIFVPGVAGSHLVKTGTNNEYWPDINIIFGNNKLELTLDPNHSKFQGFEAFEASDALRLFGPRDMVDIYGTFIDKFLKGEVNTGGIGYKEYNFINPVSRTTNGCDVQQSDANLFVFPYDWRKSNVVNVQRLHDYVGCVRKIHGEDVRINIIAHSMGGVLSRRYILEHPEQVSKFITIGTPFLGAPKAISTILKGQFFDSFVESILIARSSTMRTLVEYYPGAHELLPSKAYFDLSPGSDPNIESQFAVPYQRITFPQPPDHYQLMKNDIDNNLNVTTPVVTNENYHGFENIYGKQDDWSNDAVGGQYFHIIGVQSGNETIGQYIATGSLIPLLSPSNNIILNSNPLTAATNAISNLLTNRVIAILFPGTMTKGDGTVPLLSAARRTTQHNLNAFGAELKILEAEPSNSLVAHNGLPRNPVVHAYIKCIVAPWLQTLEVCNNLKGVPARGVQ